MSNLPIVIIGGGMVGAATALMLSQLALDVVLIEAQAVDTCQDNQRPYALRVSALQRSSEQLLRQLGAWQGIRTRRYMPFTQMHIQDWQGFSTRLTAQDLYEENLGYIIENEVINAAIWEELRQHPRCQLLQAIPVQAHYNGLDRWHITLNSGQTLTTSLLIGADGAHSQVRQWLNLAQDTHDYQQTCLVAVVNTEQHHQYSCWQHYRPEGPFALLPLNDHLCSIAWYLPNAQAEHYLASDLSTQTTAMNQASADMLGTLSLHSSLAAFPLIQRQTQHYAQPNALLIGDAAHTIHPQAGQGVNLGFLDVLALKGVLQEAIRYQQPLGDYRVLQRYERQRRYDAHLMQQNMRVIHSLFQDNATANILRKGLQPLTQLTPLRGLVSAFGLYGRLTAYRAFL